MFEGFFALKWLVGVAVGLVLGFFTNWKCLLTADCKGSADVSVFLVY